jgi:class 3 adenylate cyclase/tetratricopeptide (TPR) repeat protein
MLCPTCKIDNKAGGRFCTACGSQLTVACVTCGFSNAPGDRFCGGCGSALGAIALQAAPPDAQAAARHPVHRRAGEGERKRVTVLFADLKGSTAAIEGLDPEAAMHHLEPALQIMVRLVNRYEGVVCRRLGDGILALFGAPVAHEDHAVRACFAALGMQRALREAGMGETVRVGLNSGDVLYRTIASDLGLEIDVVGPVVHLAARMEQMAPPGSVFLTGETQALTQGLIEMRSVGPRDVRGTSAPIETYEAVGASMYVSRWQASSTRERAPFVGREAELATLQTALAALERKRGGVVGISGEAGLGKSRLVHSTIDEGSLAGAHKSIFAAATALGRTIPYHALASALRDLFRIAESDDTKRVSELVTGLLVELDPSLVPSAPVLASLISLSAATADWLAMDPRQKRVIAREACVKLARVVSAKTPLALVFEDAHWVDRDSEEVLRAMAGLARESPILVVLTYRPEYDDSWLPSVGGARLRMAPLTDEDVRRALADWFVEGPETERLIGRLTERVGGNPLFVEECVRALAQAGALTTLVVGADGATARRRYACWEAPDSIRVPPSVHDVIASRIDRRSPECVALLHTLSMVDTRIPLWLATAVSGQASAATEGALREAVTAEILVQASLYPDVEYVFAHALLREVAHDSLTRARRVEAHRRIVSAIEGHHAERPHDQAEWLAHHAAEGELWDKAALYQGEAAERALARGSYAEAITGMRAALKSYDQSAASPEATGRAIDQLRALRGMLYASGGDRKESWAILERAEELARGLDDKVRLAWVWADQSGLYWAEGRYRDAIASARRSLEIAEQASDVRLRALALHRVGLGLHLIGDYPGATVALRQTCALLSGSLRFERIGMAAITTVIAGAFLVTALCDMGELEEADQRLAETMASAAESRDMYSIASAQLPRCILAIARSDAATAIPLLEGLLRAARAGGALAVVRLMEVFLGRAKFVAGDIKGGLDLLSGKGLPEGSERSYLDGIGGVWLAEAMFASGSADEAEALLENVERDITERGEAGHLAHCWALKGRLAVARGDLAKAASEFERSLAQARRLSMRPVCEACEAELAAIAALQSAGSLQRNVEV